MSMIVVHRGAGILAPGFGLLFALLVNVLTFKLLGYSYYEEHKWPKLTVLIMAALACLAAGTLIKRKRQRDAQLKEQAVNDQSPGFEPVKLTGFSVPRDHLMFIPLQYWSIVYVVAAIIYLLVSTSAFRPSALVENNSSASLRAAVAARNADDEQIARQVKDVVVAYCRDRRGRVDAKEALAAMGAVLGERCLAAAGEIPVRTHDLEPGQRVFSDKINVLLTGDQTTELAAIRPDSIFGTIRDQLAGTRFQNQFPSLEHVFTVFAAGIWKHEWGKVPLSVPAKYWPERLPLRAAFDTRQKIDAALQPISSDTARSLHVCTLAMTMMLTDETLVDQLDPAIALTLTFETINGMAKTVPMRDKAIDKPTQAMREAQSQVLRIEPR